MTTPATTGKSVLAVRDFRLLWLGEAISTLGDQFTMIALPWLALLLTGDALALGAVMATMAVPRAVLMLIGGAYVDRFSPRRVMLASNGVRFIAVTGLGVIVLAGAAQLWMLLAFALAFGIADAFFFPAQTAIVPELVSGDQLQKANGIIQGTAQASVLVGPAVAGIAIALLGSGTSVASGTPGQVGVAAALLADGLTFVASMVTLLLITNRPSHGASVGSVLQQISEGVRFVSKAPALRLVIGLSMLANLLIVGPIAVGLPVLAYSRLPDGAAAFGLMTSAFGGGSLLGMAAAMMLPAVAPARFGTVVLGIIALAGVAVAPIGSVHSTLAAVVLSGIIGVFLGYTNLSFMSWVQRRIPRQLMGRVMSLMIFGSLALTPISMAVAGVVVTISLEGTFLVSGLGMAGLTLLSLLSGSIRRMGLEPTLDEESPPTDLAPTTSAEAAPAA
jgi:MFS transporter